MTCTAQNHTTSYYAEQAYHPGRISRQSDAQRQNWIHRMPGVRLPWGQTEDVVPESILVDPTPEDMRFWEQARKEKAEQKANGTYVPRPFEHLNMHYKHDHEVIRHAQLPFCAQFWILLKTCGKWLSILLLPLLILTHFTMLPALDESPWEGTKTLLIEFHSWFLGIPLVCAIIGHIVINYIPSLWLRAPKGPLWEFNRRTGMVTIFDYKHFKKTGEIEEHTAPFIEFDAHIVTHVDRHGPVNCLFLQHRYSKQSIGFNDLIVPDNMSVLPFALWDFLQNYMDISRPLPDIPAHEAYRHLDPVTAEYDRLTGRPPRYWIDMDNATFKEVANDILGRIYGLDTLSRPNLMARYVNYAD